MVLNSEALNESLKNEIMKMKIRNDQPLIFIIDDDEAFTKLLKKELFKANYTNLKVFQTGNECLENILEMPDIVFLDYTLEPDMDGLFVLKKIKEVNKGIYVIMFTAMEKIELAIDSLKMGAYDFVVKNEHSFMKINNRIKKIINEKQLYEISR